MALPPAQPSRLTGRNISLADTQMPHREAGATLPQKRPVVPASIGFMKSARVNTDQTSTHTQEGHHPHKGGQLGARVGGAVVMALATLGAGSAAAQPAQPQGFIPQSRPNDANAQSTGRFRTPDGQLTFTLDRTGPIALMQFEGDPEVRVLRPDPAMAAGGAQFYRTADGAVVLRITPWGELTVFMRNDRMGTAVSFSEAAGPLRPAPASPPVYRSRLEQTQQSLIRRVGRNVDVQAPQQVEGQVGGLILDAAERAADGMAAASQQPIRRLILQIGPQPAVAAQGDTLVIVVAPHLGYSGRPSSEAIRAAIENRR